MASEEDIAFGILQIAATKSNRVATFHAMRKEIPSYVNLDSQNLAPSTTRPGEPMWHQIVRNVKSHYEQDDNYLARGLLIHIPRVGYKITSAGLTYLNTN